MRRRPAALAMPVLLLAATAAPSLAQPPGPSPACLLPGIDDRCEEWVRAVDHPAREGFGYDKAAAAALSPDGSRLYVTGTTTGSGSAWPDRDFITLALDTATGGVVWKSIFGGSEENDDHPAAISVSPDGQQVFVAGTVNDTIGDPGIWNADFGVVAYDANTGTQQWDATYDGFELQGRDYGNNQVEGVAVSADGSTVYIAGPSLAGATRWDFAIFAYDARTGAERWRARYDRGKGDDRAKHLFAAGERIFVVGWGDLGTGETGQTDGDNELVVVAYEAGSGQRQGHVAWTAGWGSGAGGYPLDAALTADGDRLLVLTVVSGGYAVTSYRTADGAYEWTSPMTTGGAADLVVSAAGDRFFVTGTAVVRTVPTVFPNKDYATTAFALADGTPLWTATYGFPNADVEEALVAAVNPSGTRIYVSGTSSEPTYTYIPPITTVAYDTANGQQKWVARHRRIGAALDADAPAALAVSPSGHRVFVAGTFLYRPDLVHTKIATSDLAAIAYDACDTVCPLSEVSR